MAILKEKTNPHNQMVLYFTPELIKSGFHLKDFPFEECSKPSIDNIVEFCGVRNYS